MPREEPPGPDRDRVRLLHMRDAAREAIAFAKGRSIDDLKSDRMLARALVNAIQEIGEAAARMSENGRARASGLPWGQIVYMRHVMVHVYWGIQHEKLWDTVQNDLPVLLDEVDRALAGWPEQEGNP